MPRAQRLILNALVVASLGGTALAQTPLRPQQAPNMPPPASTIPEKMEPQDPAVTGSTGSSPTLSDRLEATDGVIRPPGGVDPEITVPVPDAGRTPIIRPPGTPGGDQSIQPK